MAFPLPIPAAVRRAVPPGTPVVLGVSGGVDSAVALAVLRELRADVQAVTLKNYCSQDGPFGGPDDRSCCSLAAIARARRLAADCGVPHLVSDVAPAFRRRVIDPFLADYAAGCTPNPCVDCNRAVRFPRLLEIADRLGAEALVATGHYARVVTEGGETALWRGVDAVKDQSYFLYALPPSLLRRTVFPLGWWTKAQVKRAARELGLAAADRPESQDVCFVPPAGREALFAPGAVRPGPIVDLAGRVLGRHRGLVHYTVGQRRGLGLGGGPRRYVVALDPARNAVVVGPRAALAVRRVVCRDLRPAPADWAEAGPAAGLTARVRYRQRGVPVAAWRRSGDRLELELAEPVTGVAPGQSCVLDRGGRIVGGGVITAAGAAPAGKETA